MTTAPTDKAEALAGVDSSRTLNESYHSSDYSIEEDPQEESAVATARPGDFRKAEPGLRQPLVCEYTLIRCHNSSCTYRTSPGHLDTILPCQFVIYQMAIKRYKFPTT